MNHHQVSTALPSTMEEKAAAAPKQQPTTLARLLHQPVSFTPAGAEGYLLGLRGLFTLSSFLWTFLSTFLPVSVKDAHDRSGPLWQRILRDTFSVIFWNESLIYSFFILVSARTVAIPFLLSPSRTAVASAVLRRGLRLWFPVAVALAVVKILSSTGAGTAYIDAFRERTGNSSVNTPYSLPSALAYFNSVFNLFWTTARFSEQAGNTAFPGQMLWIVNVIYAQSYTVYMTMVIIPYTRNAWRVKAYLAFIVTAWWVQSWAWYTVTGLLFADVVMNMRFKDRAQRGIPLWWWGGKQHRCPVWVPAAVLAVSGLLMQYLWTSWRPEYANKELLAHTGLYYTGGLNTLPHQGEPQARDDNYLVLLGLFLVVETVDWVQKSLQFPLFLYLGRRSLSWFLTQSIIVYSAGIKIHQHLTVGRGVPDTGATAVCLLVCLPTTVVFAELFYRLVDWPSQILAHIVFDWIRE